MSSVGRCWNITYFMFLTSAVSHLPALLRSCTITVWDHGSSDRRGDTKTDRPCPAAAFLHNSKREGGMLWKANLDIITSLLASVLLQLEGWTPCYRSPFSFVICMTWLDGCSKKKTRPRDDVHVGCVVCQVETGLVEFRLIAICPLSTCLNTHMHAAVDEFPALCMGCIINAYVVFGVALSSFHMEMWCDESRLRPATA